MLLIHSRIITCCLLIIFFLPHLSAIHAANRSTNVTGSFKGIVTSGQNGKPVANAQINLTPLQLKTTTDTLGRFIYDSIHAGLYSVSISAPGFDTLLISTVQIKSKKNVMQEYTLIKSEHISSLATTIVRTQSSVKNPAATNSFTHLGMYELNNTPAAFNDINRIIASTPSALLQAGADFYSGAVVRGGNPAENVYLLDGFELENLDHFADIQSSMGAVSFINTSLCKSLDFYSGAFPAGMSPALSSVTSIDFRQGSLTDRKYQIDLSIQGLGLTAEGPFPKSKGSYLASGRMVNTRFLRNFIKDMPAMPGWEDFLIKMSTPINHNSEIGLLAVGAGDQIYLHQYQDDFYCYADGGMTYSQMLGGLYWQSSKDVFFNKLQLSGRSFKAREYWDLDKSGRNRWRFTNIWDRNWQRYNLQMKDNLTIFLGDNQLNTGISGEKIWYRRFNRKDASDYPVYDTFFINTPIQLPDTLLKPGDSWISLNGYAHLPLNAFYNRGEHYAGFLEYIWSIHPFKIIAGLRDDYFTLLHKHGPSPRLGVVVNPDNIGRFSLSCGLYYQFPSYLNNIITDSAFMPLISSYKLERSRQVSAGYERQIGKSHLLRAETYQKWYDREFMYYTPEEPDLDSVQYNGAQNGKKKVFGCELQFRKRSFDKIYYSLSYSLVNAEDLYSNGVWYGDKNSVRNIGSAVLGTNFLKHHGFALQLTAREGQPYSVLEVIKYESTGSDGVKQTEYYASYPDQPKWNSKRRNPYVALGVRYDFKVYRKWGNLTGYFDVSNILNNTPVIDETIDKETGKVVKQYAAGILPMFGLTVDF